MSKNPVAAAFLLCALLLGSAGCATNPTTRSALLLIDQIDIYQTKVNAKLQAEQEFYAQTRKDLTEDAKAQAENMMSIQRLRTLTEIADQAAVRDKGLQLSVLQEFLRADNESARNAEQEQERLLRELKQAYRINFDALVDKRAELSRARAALLSLSRDKQTRANLVTFIQESTSAAIKLQEDDDSQE